MFLTVKNAKEYDKVKSEFHSLVWFLEKNNFDKGLDYLKQINNQLQNKKQLTLSSILDFESSIDARKVKCSCGKENCKVGLNFDENVMLLTNKFGNETAMQLDKQNIDEIILHLRQIKKQLK